MKRRPLLFALAGSASALAVGLSRTAAASPSLRVDAPSPRVRALAEQQVQGATSERERALRLFHFMRDEIRFGFTSRFDQATPEETLEARRGHCNPQAALFASLLHAAGLQARVHFVSIPNDILAGTFSVGLPSRLDHGFVEVVVEGRPVRLDGYIVDKPLYQGAVARLRKEGRKMGWGVHVDGRMEWDGVSDCMSQFVSPDMMLADHGTFLDPAEHYASPRYSQRIPWPARLGFNLFGVPEANSRLDAVRAV